MTRIAMPFTQVWEREIVPIPDGHIQFHTVMELAGHVWGQAISQAFGQPNAHLQLFVRSATADYRSELSSGDGEWDVVVSALGTTSVTLVLTAFQDGRSAATVTFRLVQVDAIDHRPTPFTADQRAALEAMAGPAS